MELSISYTTQWRVESFLQSPLGVGGDQLQPNPKGCKKDTTRQTTKIVQQFYHTFSCTNSQRSKNLRDVIIWYNQPSVTLERDVTIWYNPLQHPSGLYFSYNPQLNQSESRNAPQCMIMLVTIYGITWNTLALFIQPTQGYFAGSICWGIFRNVVSFFRVNCNPFFNHDICNSSD